MVKIVFRDTGWRRGTGRRRRPGSGQGARTLPAGTRRPGPLGGAGASAVLERPRALARPRGALVAVRLGSRAGTGLGTGSSCDGPLGPELSILETRAWARVRPGTDSKAGSCSGPAGLAGPAGTAEAWVSLWSRMALALALRCRGLSSGGRAPRSRRSTCGPEFRPIRLETAPGRGIRRGALPVTEVGDWTPPVSAVGASGAMATAWPPQNQSGLRGVFNHTLGLP